MDKYMKIGIFSCILVSIFAASQAQTCSNYRFQSNSLLNFSACNDLPVLNSFLHYTYHPGNATVDIAYRHTGLGQARWVAWALNPAGSGMVGAQALVAFQNSSGATEAYTSPVPNRDITGLAPGPLSFNVPRLVAEFQNNEMIIFATLELPNNRTSFNQVWQEGPLSGDSPARHNLGGNNFRSVGAVNFLSGQGNTNTDTGSGGGVVIPRLRRKNIHGVLNVVSWGILMPIGAIVARYLKVFKSADPTWFYLHVACQSTAYAVGVAGWGTGLKLGSDSVGLIYNTHRNIGITLFCLATLQVFALLLRPNKDHKYRVFWNAYHHAVGYAVVSLSIANIFQGFDILNPDKKWKNAYIGIIIALGSVAVLLEAYTWFVVLKRKKKASSSSSASASVRDKHANGANPYTNGINSSV